MFEDLFEFSDKLIPENESTSGMITFEEYLGRISVQENSPGMITFEEYLERKLTSDFTLDDVIEEDSSPGMMTFIEYLKSKDILVEEEGKESQTKPIPQTNLTKKTLWDGYVQHVKSHAKKAPVVNIQDPQYLDESRKLYAEFLIEEQKKVWDKIYFFTPGGRAVIEEETECAVIGKAVIGKNKIC